MLSSFEGRFPTDPRLQLYTVTSQKLKQLEADFDKQPLSKHLLWTGHFSQMDRSRKRISFIDDLSTIRADSAEFVGIYERTEQELTFSLKLFRDGSLYVREADIDTYGNGGFYDIHLAFETPPTIVPSGAYDYTYQTLSDLHRLSRESIGEPLGSERARSLLDLLATFTIHQLDIGGFDTINH